MTNKTKMSNLESYTELSIQIATLDMKLDAILKLLNKPEITLEPLRIKSLKDIMPEDIEKARLLFKDLVPAGSSVDTTITCGVGKLQDTPLQRPNESHTDYLKRNGQYNEASSDNENFEDSFK